MRARKALLKSILYRIYSSFLVTPLIVFALTGKLALSLTVGAVELAVKVVTYFVYELLWGKTMGYDGRGAWFERWLARRGRKKRQK